MVFDYFAFARAKKNQEELEKTNPQNPVLNPEDEQFLEKVTSHRDTPAAPLPPQTTDHTPKDVRTTTQKAKEVPLPDQDAVEASILAATTVPQKRTWASYVPSAPNMPSLPPMPSVPSVSMPTMPTMPSWRGKQPTSTTTATGDKVDEKVEDIPAYPPGVKVTEGVKLDEAKREEDEKEVSVLLDRLNLSSINNRVFSFSKESQKLYEDFLLVLKDMINGAPTAYQDMERLLKENDAQLRAMFASMPPFVQTLVKSLPAKLGGTLGPEMLAAASEKPGADMKARMEAASGSTATKKKKNVPSIKGLASEQGAVAGMLRSIVAFLKTRFPAFVTGTNVIMSLAVFLMLFVFWYCHKRGRETRLEKEKGMEDSMVFTEESEGEEEEVQGDEEGRELPMDGEMKSDEARELQDILDQKAPAEVPLPVGDEGIAVGKE